MSRLHLHIKKIFDMRIKLRLFLSLLLMFGLCGCIYTEEEIGTLSVNSVKYKIIKYVNARGKDYRLGEMSLTYGNCIDYNIYLSTTKNMFPSYIVHIIAYQPSNSNGYYRIETPMIYDEIAITPSVLNPIVEDLEDYKEKVKDIISENNEGIAFLINTETGKIIPLSGEFYVEKSGNRKISLEGEIGLNEQVSVYGKYKYEK